jgi:hypothetical protein
MLSQRHGRTNETQSLTIRYDSTYLSLLDVLTLCLFGPEIYKLADCPYFLFVIQG